jgi:integrase
VNLTIQSAADAWLHTLETRKRKPVKPATLKTFESYIRAHIVPSIGRQQIDEFGNAQLREFVAHLDKKELSPKTINEIAGTVKQIVASVVNEHGDPLYPRTWNADFLDMPTIENQKQPTVTAAEIERVIADAPETDAILYLLLAASGLRIGEALSLRVQPSENSSFFADGAITVRKSVWCRTEQSPKTASAKRTVEIAAPATERIAKFAEGRSGYLFGNGLPPSESTLRDHLVEVGIPGFHAFRRFRTTWLRKQRAPDDLIRFWLGHAEESVTDGYSKLSEDVVYRREIAEKVGVGFSL